jgi:uncharacterized protein
VTLHDYTLADNTPWRLYAPDSPVKEWAILWLQGFTSTIDGHQEGCRRMSAATNVTLAMLNYAGHGNHPVALEHATREQQLEEVCSVYDKLTELGYTKIIVIGGSFGAYMTALLLENRTPKVVVLRAPANYKDEEMSLPYRQTTEAVDGEAKDLYRQNIDSSYSNKAIEAVRKFNGTTYVIEHGEDEVVYRNMPQSYFNAAMNGNYIIIPGLKHSPKLMGNPQKYFKITEAWIETIVKSTIELDEVS